MITELTRIQKKWLRWLRFRRSILWAVRGLLLGLAVSFGISLLLLFQARLVRSEFLSLTSLMTLVGILTAAILAYVWPVDPLIAARYFDHTFNLKERVSTALELNREENHHAAEMVRRQLQDALNSARKVQPGRALPIRLKVTEGMLALAILLLIGLVWFRGESWFQAAHQVRAVEDAVAQQATSIEEILTQIESNPTLSEEQKQALTDPLEQTLKGLQENPSLEGSVSLLVNSGEELQALSDSGAQQMSQSLQEAGLQLAEQEGSPLSSIGQKLAEGNTLSAALELARLDLNDLSQAEADDLASQLESMAQTLDSVDPQLASQLNQAAQALRDGDLTAAQQALNQASESLSKAGQQVVFSQVAQQAAQQMQQGASQVLAAGGGSQAGQDGQAAAQPGSTDQGGPATGGAGSGSGNESGGTPSQGSEAGSSPIPQNNAPGDGGEKAYEQIYAPSLLGGDAGPIVTLPGSGEDGTLLGESPSVSSEPGDSLVPYDQVYAQYEQVNREAIEQGEVPLQFVQIIRNYFDSLNP